MIKALDKKKKQWREYLMLGGKFDNLKDGQRMPYKDRGI